MMNRVLSVSFVLLLWGATALLANELPEALPAAVDSNLSPEPPSLEQPIVLEPATEQPVQDLAVQQSPAVEEPPAVDSVFLSHFSEEQLSEIQKLIAEALATSQEGDQTPASPLSLPIPLLFDDRRGWGSFEPRRAKRSL